MRRNGFTLVELVAVIGLVAILSLVAIPRAGNMVADMRLNTSARAVYNAIITARQLAIAEQRSWQVSVLPASGQVRLYRDPDYMNDVRQYRVVLPSGITTVNPNTFEFRFNVYGEPTVIASIGLQNTKGRILNVVIAMSGRVRISSD